MTRGSFARAGQLAARGLRSRITAAPASGSAILRSVPSVLRESPHSQYSKSNSQIPTLRPFSTTSSATAPLAPDVLSRVKPADITDGQYHELSDEYLDNLLNKFEAAQDERDNLDVEYSSGVMNISIAEIGTYVINKQPPNKQIWLSSPVSGPKRFDYVVVSDGQHQKEGTATGGWVYLRDGTTLDEILREETGIDPEEPPVDAVDS